MNCRSFCAAPGVRIALMLSCAIVALTACRSECQVTGGDSTDAAATEYNNELRLELIDMLQRDQAIRMEIMQAPSIDSTLARRGLTIDRDNAVRIREIIKTYGWPGTGMVGFDGVQAACVLVLHVDDKEFQKECLPLMKKAADAGEVPMMLIAYLTDRVLALDGQKQIYGTQGKMIDGEFRPFPLEDEEHIDSIRGSVGLPPFAEYGKMMKAMYTRPDTLKQ
jgi:hypothetical protein